MCVCGLVREMTQVWDVCVCVWSGERETQVWDVCVCGLVREIDRYGTCVCVVW